MMFLKGKLPFYEHSIKGDFSNRTTLRPFGPELIVIGLKAEGRSTCKPLSQYSKTHYSIVPAFQHSNCGAKRS